MFQFFESPIFKLFFRFYRLWEILYQNWKFRHIQFIFFIDALNFLFQVGASFSKTFLSKIHWFVNKCWSDKYNYPKCNKIAIIHMKLLCISIPTHSQEFLLAFLPKQRTVIHTIYLIEYKPQNSAFSIRFKMSFMMNLIALMVGPNSHLK